MIRTPATVWILWCAAVALVTLVLLFPLHSALSLAGLEARGLTARNVSGTIWLGSIDQVQTGGQPLGSFDLELQPFALALLATEWRFERQGSTDGPFGGRIRSGGGDFALRDLDGRVPASGLFAPLPVDTLDVIDATIRFADGRCVEAAGTVRAMPATVAGLGTGSDGSEPLEGPLACDDGRLRLTLTGQSRGRIIDIRIAGDGGWTGALRILRPTPEMQFALPLAGFRPEGTGYVLTREGRIAGTAR